MTGIEMFAAMNCIDPDYVYVPATFRSCQISAISAFSVWRNVHGQFSSGEMRPGELEYVTGTASGQLSIGIIATSSRSGKPELFGFQKWKIVSTGFLAIFCWDGIWRRNASRC